MIWSVSVASTGAVACACACAGATSSSASGDAVMDKRMACDFGMVMPPDDLVILILRMIRDSHMRFSARTVNRLGLRHWHHGVPMG